MNKKKRADIDDIIMSSNVNKWVLLDCIIYYLKSCLKVPYTRIIEHKHFEYGPSLGKIAEGQAATKTIVTREYPDKWVQGKEPYYTMNDEKNTTLYAKYKELADKDSKVTFGGRLGQYKYFDMDKVIVEALKCVNEELK